MGKEFMCYSCGQPFYASNVNEVYQMRDDYMVVCEDCYRQMQEDEETEGE